VAVSLLAVMAVQSAVMIRAGVLFIREDFRTIARESITANRAVCYAIPDGLTKREADDFRLILGFYVTRIFGRADLSPRTFTTSEITAGADAGNCGLWADPHPEGKVSVLRMLPRFQGCMEIPLADPRKRLTSVLLSCRPGA